MRKRVLVQVQFEQGMPEVEMGYSLRRHAVVLSADSHNVKGERHPKAPHKMPQSGYFQVPNGKVAVTAGCPKRIGLAFIDDSDSQGFYPFRIVMEGQGCRGSHENLKIPCPCNQDFRNRATPHFTSADEEVPRQSSGFFCQGKDRRFYNRFVVKSGFVVIVKNVKCPGADIQHKVFAH
jgi:hypothetical protein